MGQAKQRGTFEERVQQSKERQHAEYLIRVQKQYELAEKRKREAKEWWDSLTEDQKEIERIKYKEKHRYAHSNSTTMMVVASAVAIAMSSGYRRI